MRNGNKLNLEYVSEKFEIDENRGITKCIMVCNPHIKDFAELYWRPSDETISKEPIRMKGFAQALSNDTFSVTGVSKCSKDDTYDREKGIELARVRARLRAERKYKHLVECYLFATEDLLRRILHSWHVSNVSMASKYRLEKEYAR